MAEKCYRYRAEYFHGLCANRFKDVSGSGECTICVKPTVTYPTGICGCSPNEIVLPRGYRLKVEKSDIFGGIGRSYEYIVGEHTLANAWHIPSFQPAGLDPAYDSCSFSTDGKYWEQNQSGVVFRGFFRFAFDVYGSTVPVTDGVKKRYFVLSLIGYRAYSVNGNWYPVINTSPIDTSPVVVARWNSTEPVPVCSYDYKFEQELTWPISPSLQENFKLTLSN